MRIIDLRGCAHHHSAVARASDERLAVAAEGQAGHHILVPEDLLEGARVAHRVKLETCAGERH